MILLADLKIFKGDADMYVRRNQLPSLSEYDWRDISIKKNFSLVIPAET